LLVRLAAAAVAAAAVVVAAVAAAVAAAAVAAEGAGRQADRTCLLRRLSCKASLQQLGAPALGPGHPQAREVFSSRHREGEKMLWQGW